MNRKLSTFRIVITFVCIDYKAPRMAKSKPGPPHKGKLSWNQALKKWNDAHSTAMWCVPRKYDPHSGPGWAGRTTPEYQEIRDLMKHGALSKGQMQKGEKRVAQQKAAPFVGRSRVRAQKGMTEAQKREYEAVMAGVRRAHPPARAAPIKFSSSSATKAEPRRVGNRITL